MIFPDPLPEVPLSSPSSALKPSPAPSGVRRWPWWLKLSAAVALLFILASLVAPLLLPWSRLRRQAVDAGSRRLGRTLAIGDVKVGLFSGVTLRDFSLANAGAGYADQPLFRASEARLSVSLLPLFSGRVVVDQLLFVKPDLLLETDRRGVSNLSGLGSAAPGSQASPARASQASSAQAPQAFPVLVENFEIQDATLTLRDDRRPGQDRVVHHFNLKVLGLGLEHPGTFRVESGLTLTQGDGSPLPVALSGVFTYDPAAGSLRVQRLNLTAPSLAVDASGLLTDVRAPKGKLGLDLKADLAHLPVLIAAFKPTVGKALEGMLAGQAQAHADVTLEGGPGGMADGLRATATFGITDAVLQACSDQLKIARALPYAPVRDLLSRPLTFATVRGALDYAGGKATLTSFEAGSGPGLRGGAMFLQASGWLIPGGAVDLSFVPHLNPAMMKGGPGRLAALADPQGWPTLDWIGLKGADFASARPDVTPVLKKAARAVWSRAKGRLTRTLGARIRQALPKGLPSGVSRGLGRLFGN